MNGYRGARRLIDAVELAATDTPDAVAVTAPDGTFTFAEVLTRARQLSGALADVRGEESVGLYLGRSRHMVPGLLAVWLAGASAVLMDPAHPAERMKFLREDANLRLVVAERPPDGLAPTTTLISPDATGPLSARRPVHPENRAYLVYTSGTTGRPKGVETSYRNLDTFLDALALLRLERGGLGLNAVSPAFDGWLWCTLLYLLHGKGVAIVDPAGDQSLDATLATLRTDTVSLTPSLLATLKAPLPTTKVLVVAGEACPPAMARRWQAGRRLLNVYGPSETTIAATWADTAAGDDPTTIGRPMPGYRGYVLDERLEPVAADEIGELYVSGPAVARGYRNRPGLTASRFLPDPFATGSRMYRTGDLVRLDEHGRLHFLGRADNQVKLRGFRVELGEVERVAAQVAGVAATACFVATAGDVLGLAFVALAGHDPAVVAKAIRARCAELLPDFMCPATVDEVPALPTAHTGKVDRTALARALAYSDSGRSPGDGRPPSTAREHQVCEVWANHLGRPVTDVDGNFFELGGHSLLAARAVAELRRRTGLPVSARHLLSNPTAADLAGELDRLAAQHEMSAP
ncbi:non-ribosomal peptide synthetase [Kibdelosporangium persicum]|uniref:Nonribosomal peptide synthetase DhbF n=1 Tax=Kibdelosporangium persicum TaxID=2698649 RepID=A0ABX2FH15_9PSEU|nr:non-ribosomal peptide synthetase [Kibdelosporangium persicum]NRN70675.1 Nonribosomal peptide synthetase DhbF [Kibdelosporangium persicum]